MPGTNEPETARLDATCTKIAETEKKYHPRNHAVGALSLAGGMLVREAENDGADVIPKPRKSQQMMESTIGTEPATSGRDCSSSEAQRTW